MERLVLDTQARMTRDINIQKTSWICSGGISVLVKRIPADFWKRTTRAHTHTHTDAYVRAHIGLRDKGEARASDGRGESRPRFRKLEGSLRAGRDVDAKAPSPPRTHVNISGIYGGAVVICTCAALSRKARHVCAPPAAAAAATRVYILAIRVRLPRDSTEI